MKIIQTSIDNITKYRADYLNSLPEFQELFIELMVPGADCFIVQSGATEVGYAIKTTDGVLVEFYVSDKYLPESNAIFRQVLHDLSINGIYCKSFDALLLSNCLRETLPYSVLGMLYRDYIEPQVKKDGSIAMKPADGSSVRLLMEQDESIYELFETEQQLIGFIEHEHVFEFYKNDEFVGCGMVLRTHPEWSFCDLGVWVHPQKRGHAIGAQIILNLREFSLKNNVTPSCGCAKDNVASQKTIEKSGFASRYNLIEFTA